MTLEHGSCIKYQDKGILILGPSGSGKSDLALRLIDDGGVLISDDYVEIEYKDGAIIANTAPNIGGMIEVRGIGLIKLDYLKSSPLHLVLDLVQMKEIDRIPEKQFYRVMDCEVLRVKFDAFSASAVAKIKILLKQ